MNLIFNKIQTRIKEYHENTHIMRTTLICEPNINLEKDKKIVFVI